MKYLILPLAFVLFCSHQLMAKSGDTLDYKVINNIPYTNNDNSLQ